MLPIAIGNDGHDDIVADLSAMPHLLIGGCDGYGKTTFLQNAINSISCTGSSKLILVDSKDDDFKDYSNLDCLACPIIHDFGALVEKLEWLLEKLEERYYLLASAGSRNIIEYNQKAIEKMSYLVLGIADYSAYVSPLRSDSILNFFSRICAKSKAATSCIEKKTPQIILAIPLLITTETREKKKGILSTKYFLIKFQEGINKEIFSAFNNIRNETAPEIIQPTDCKRGINI